MLTKIFKSDKTHDNSQPPNHSITQPQHLEHNQNITPIQKYKFHMLKSHN